MNRTPTASPVLEMLLSSPDPLWQRHQRVRSALHEQLFSLSFHAFEACISELLAKLGYTEVRLLGRTHWKQYTKHGGCDLEARAATGITAERLIMQLKQYHRPVSRRFVDELRGTMQRQGAGLGLIIATSRFSTVAHRAAESNQIAPVRLVDGEELLDLLFTHRIGVWSETYPDGGVWWHVDEPYFANLNKRFPGRPRPVVPTPAPVQLTLIPVTRTELGGLKRRQKGGAMLWRTHVIGGVAALWILATIPGALTHENVGILVGLAALGSLLPDLDAAESKIKHLSIGRIQPFAPLATVTHKTFGHRGLLHSLAGIIGIAIVALPLAVWWNWPSAIALVVGYTSHIALDACTRSGVPFLPTSRRRLHLLPQRFRVVTGSLAEEALFPLLALAGLLLVLRALYL